MEFSIEFYVTRNGDVPVQDFLEQMRQTDPDDHAAVLRGLAKLRNRQYHRQPLSKALGSGLFELRHVGKLNTRDPVVLYERAGASSRCMAFATRARPSRLTISR